MRSAIHGHHRAFANSAQRIVAHKTEARSTMSNVAHSSESESE